MVRQKDDFQSFHRFAQVHVTMRMRVLVAGYRAGKEIRPSLAFTGFGRWIHQGAILGAKRFSHQLNPDVAIGQHGCLADRHFYGLHCLKGGDIEFSSQEGMPYRFSDSRVQYFTGKEACDLEAGKIRFCFDFAPSSAQL